MRWELRSLQLLASEPSHGDKMDLVQFGECLTITVVEDMEVLGLLLTSASDILRPVRHRLSKATSASWSLDSVLGCPE